MVFAKEVTGLWKRLKNPETKSYKNRNLIYHKEGIENQKGIMKQKYWSLLGTCPTELKTCPCRNLHISVQHYSSQAESETTPIPIN